jgi:hypothetical protein
VIWMRLAFCTNYSLRQDISVNPAPSARLVAVTQLRLYSAPKILQKMLLIVRLYFCDFIFSHFNSPSSKRELGLRPHRNTAP